MMDTHGKRGPIDLYTLAPGLTYRIYDANKQELKRVALIKKGGATLQPIVLDP